MNRLFFFLIVFLIAACSAQLRIPTQVDADRGASRWENYDSLKLVSGFFIYKNNCGQCHNLHLPKEFSEQQWNNILPEMVLKAHLDSSQTDLVKKYLLVMAADTLKK